MSRVQIYTDETYGHKKSFLIQSVIWGNPDHCNNLRSMANAIITKHKKKLGSEFKELHAMNVNQKNWKVFGPVYEEILDLFFDMVSQHNVGLLIVIMSKARFDNNAGYLTDTLKPLITDRTSGLGKLFSSFEDKDLPAVYYRIHQLFLLFKYRGLFGKEGDILEYFPDSTGKVLHYVDRKFAMSGTLPISLPFDYLEIIRMFGHSFIKAFSNTFAQFEPGSFPTISQELGVFKPTDSSADIIIQLCDTISNFTFAHICHKTGLTAEKFELKSDLIEKYLALDAFDPIIQQSFSLSGNEVMCNNHDLWGNIQAMNK